MTKILLNTCCLLLMFLIGAILGGYYGYTTGRHDINNRLVVASWQDGYMTGHCEGGVAVMRVMFEKELEGTEYDLHQWDE